MPVIDNDLIIKRPKRIEIRASDEEYALWTALFRNISKTIRTLLNAAAEQEMKKRNAKQT